MEKSVLLLHPDGESLIAYSTFGDYIISGSSDGLVRILSTSKSSDASSTTTIDHHEDPITSIVVQDNYAYTASEDNTIAEYNMDEGKFKRTLASFSSRINCMDIATKDKTPVIVAGLENGTLAFLPTQNTEKKKEWSKCLHSISCVKFNSNGLVLACLDKNGDLQLWDMKQQEPQIIKVLPGVGSKSVAGISWTPGDALSIPNSKNDVVNIEMESWTISKTFEMDFKESLRACSWSPNGRYLLCFSKNVLSVFDSWTFKSITSQQEESDITSAAWHPTKNEVSYTIYNGRLIFWKSVIDIEQGFLHPAKKGLEMDKNEDSDKENISRPTRRSKALILNKNKDIFTDDEGSIDGEEDSIKDFIEDDLGEMEEIEFDDEDDIKQQGSLNTTSGLVLTNTQNCFQPGATPEKNKRKYLAFNMTGVIYSIDQDVHSVVHIEYFDKSLHKDHHFTDHYQYSMASLGSKGVVFACESSHGNPSTLYYRPSASWGTKSDWIVQLREFEDIKCVGLTANGPVIVTSKDYVRMFSHSGVQTHLFSLDGPVVALNCWENRIIFSYNSGVTFSSKPALSYSLYDFEAKKCISKNTIPLSNNSTLVWIGFSENGLPATFDSKGVLRLLNSVPPFQYHWIPVFESSEYNKIQNKKDVYWAVGLTENEFFCVTCKGSSSYPSFPRPMIDELPLQIPLVNLDKMDGLLEERVMRGKVFLEHHRHHWDRSQPSVEQKLMKEETSIDKLLLQLIQNSCATERTQRALDLSSMLAKVKAIDGAIKLASLHHQTLLAERINIVKEVKLLEEQKQFSHSISTLSSPARAISRNSRRSLQNDLPPKLTTPPKVIPKQVLEETTVVEDSLPREVLPDPSPISKPKMSSKKLGKMPVRKGFNPFATSSTPEDYLINRSDSFFDTVERHIEDLPEHKIETIVVIDELSPTKQASNTKKETTKRKAQTILSSFARGSGEKKNRTEASTEETVENSEKNCDDLTKSESAEETQEIEETLEL